ncbi:MAG: AMP-binding protein [Thermomicrobiales bacterium]
MALMLADIIDQAERLYGANLAVVCGSTRLNYAEFGDRCRRLASGLRQLGIGAGDRVAVLMNNCHRYLEVYCAVPASGAILVPLNTRHTLEEHRRTLADCSPRLLIVDEDHRETALKIASAELQLLAAPDGYEELVARSTPEPFAGDIDEDDPAGLFYTSGTTGAPKGAVLSHRNLIVNAFNMIVGAGYQEADRFLHTAPMFHLADGSSIYALTWRGSRHVILPGFHPRSVLETIEHAGITCTIMVPTMIDAIVNDHAANGNLASLRLILHGGAPISADLLRAAVSFFGCAFTQAYGLTEGSSHIALLPHEERILDEPRARSAGREILGCEIVVRHSDGRPCQTGAIGEVTVRGPNITRGYWNRPEDSAQSIRDGWFWTGDLGYLDAEGYLYLAGRSRDLIISGGENIYASEVEESYARIPPWRLRPSSACPTTIGANASMPSSCRRPDVPSVSASCAPSAASGSPVSSVRAPWRSSTSYRFPALEKC